MLALLALLIIVKLATLVAAPEDQRSPRQLLTYLALPNLVTWSRFGRPLPSRPMAFVLRRMGRMTFKLVLGAALVAATTRSVDTDAPWVLRHLLALLTIYTLASALGELTSASVVAIGHRVDDIYRDLYRASSILDFWARYNQPVHYLLYDYVYRPAQKRIGPRGAVLASFAVSGLIHEYVFIAVDPRLAGLQMAFFMLQGVAGLAEVWIRRRLRLPRRLRLLYRVPTWLFIFFSTELFLQCFSRIWDGPHQMVSQLLG